jgi:hypothetical protein
MSDSNACNYFQQQQDRQELGHAVDTLGSFIAKHSVLDLRSSCALALQIFQNGESSGCVSVARATRLLAEINDA